MSIEGRIAIDATFNDMDSSGIAHASKTISLTSSTPYTTGKVAVVSGTIGTAQVFLNLYSTQYRDASGNLVTFASTAISRIAFAFQGAAGQSRALLDNNGTLGLISRDNEVACASVLSELTGVIEPAANTGTYTVVLYGT
jgi:hypothetical protein